jgi:hypothetical protein
MLTLNLSKFLEHTMFKIIWLELNMETGKPLVEIAMKNLLLKKLTLNLRHPFQYLVLIIKLILNQIIKKKI